MLSSLALVFVGGDQYAAIEDRLWQFAILGTLLSMIQLLVYALIAQRGGRATWLLWGALVVIVACSPLTGSIMSLLLLVLVVDAVLLVGLLVPVVFFGPRNIAQDVASA